MSEAPRYLDCNAFMAYTGMTKNKFYQFAHMVTIPVITIRKRIYIDRDGFDQWMNNQAQERSEIINGR